MLLKAYSGFFLLPSRLASLLLVAATFVEPTAGLSGLLAGGTTWLSLRWLDISAREDHLEMVNGVLLGLLLGATYLFTPKLLLLILACGPMAALGTKLCSECMLRLPILCAPFAIGGLLFLSAGSSLYLPLAQPRPFVLATGSSLLDLYLRSLGSMYLSPYPASGLLILLALAVSCRYLTGLTLVGFVASEFVMLGLEVTDPTTRMIGATGAILCSLILGGLMVAPRLSSIVLAFSSAAAATGLYLCLVGLLARLGLPPLAWPFICITWTAILALPKHRSLDWQHPPALPIESAERVTLAKARGVCSRSIPLRAPFTGAWSVYQSIDGPHTHQGPWRYALDFIISKEGLSYQGEGRELQDYYCFGKPICSPAEGTVVTVQDDISDNAPGEVNIQQRFGNYVLVALGPKRYLLLAHLRRGSIRVSPGQQVKLGEQVAQCGNSGRSPQPHLHLHIQTGTELGSPTVEFHLSGVKINGDFTLNRIPQECDAVEAPEYNQPLRKALELQVGRRLIFLVDREGLTELQTLEVSLDLSGRFWLEARNGARVSLYQDHRVLTCFDRNHVPDPLLDLFTLALGVTPLCEQPGEWQDSPPIRLLSGKIWSWRQCGHSAFKRSSKGPSSWIQIGEHADHKNASTRLETRARFNLEKGLRELTLSRQGEVRFSARVVGVGMNADLGTPGWEVPVAETGALAAAT